MCTIAAQISLKKQKQYEYNNTDFNKTKSIYSELCCVLHSDDISNVRLCDEFLQSNNHIYIQFQKLGKIFTGPTYKLLLRFTVICDVYRSFIPNKRVSREILDALRN